MHDPERGIEDYKPGAALVGLYWILVLSLIGLGFVIRFLQTPGESLHFVGWPWLVFLLAMGVAGPPAIQRLAIHRFGLRTSGVTWGGASPYLAYLWKVEDRKLTKTQFAAVYGLPAAFLCVCAIVYVALSPGVFVIIGFVVAGNAGSLWFSAKALRKPEGTLVEEAEKGVRFHHPAVH